MPFSSSCLRWSVFRSFCLIVSAGINPLADDGEAAFFGLGMWGYEVQMAP